MPMKICIAGSNEIVQQITAFIGLGHFVEIQDFSLAISLLNQIRAGQKWDIAYIDENIADIPGSSLAALLEYEMPGIPIILLNGFDKIELSRQLNTILGKLDRQEGDMAPPPCNNRLKHFVFNAKKSMVYKKGEPIQLRKKEAKLLEYLLRYKDKLVTKQTLLEAVWSYKYSHNSHTVSSHIAQLRQKLGSDVIHIKNLPRQGYLLTQST